MKKALLALFLLPFLYWIPINLGLLLKVVPIVASEGRGKSFNIDYKFAYSLIPTYVHLYGLHLDGTDINVHWQVKIDHLTFRHSIRELFKRSFHARDIRGGGVWVGVRQHLDSEKAEVLRILGPQIPTKESDPLPWRVTLSDIRLDNVSHAHVDSIVFNGNSTATGGFMLLPGRVLILAPCEWKIQNGTLSQKETPVLIETQGSTTIAIHPTDLIHTKGSQIFQTMDIHNSLRGNVLSADFFGVLYRPYKSNVTGTTKGTFYSEFDIKKGIFQVGSKVTSELTEISLALQRTKLNATGHFQWGIEAEKTGSVARFSIPLKNVQWKRDQSDLADAKLISINGSSHKLDLQDLFTDLEIKLKAKDIKLYPIHRILAAYSKKPESTSAITSDMGTANLNALFQSKDGLVNSDFTYQTPRVELSYNKGKTRLIGKMKTQIKLVSHETGNSRFELGKTSTDLESIRVINDQEEEYEDDGWKINVSLENGKIDFDPFKIIGVLRLKMTDLKLPIRFLVPDTFLVKVGTFFFPMKDFRGFGQFSHDDDETSVKRFEAQTSSGKIDGSFLTSDAGPELAFLFSLGSTRLCVSQKKGEANPGVRFSKIDECQNDIKSYNERRY